MTYSKIVKKKKKEKKKKRIMFLVATMSLPAVYRPNDDRWNAARSCQFGQNWMSKSRDIANIEFPVVVVVVV